MRVVAAFVAGEALTMGKSDVDWTFALRLQQSSAAAGMLGEGPS
jgi:hypothetical protein